MRFDLVTIFPQFFDSLQLSLLGKAQKSGNLEISTHDLRDWATGRHLAVDDSPAGGGAGMVMRADVWGRALDQILDWGPDRALDQIPDRAAGETDGRLPHRVLAVPTPSGRVLTQRDLERLAEADQIVIACGRYEGIDSRVADFFRSEDSGVEVFEYSLGDYVLNGGEVAAVALVEGVSRLLAGVIGNPESLAEESHSDAGLLEYPVFTQPPSWRGLDIPDVLRSGDHGRIARWRRDRSLEKTAEIRPDMVWSLAARPRDERGRPEGLDTRDLEVLVEHGFLLVPRFRAAKMWCAFPQSQPESQPESQSQSQSQIESSTNADEGLAGGALRQASAQEGFVLDSLYEVVADLAAKTFPMACPPGTTEAEIAAFVAENLTPDALRVAVEQDGARICVATVHDATPPWENPEMASHEMASHGAHGAAQTLAGYTLVLPRAPKDVAGAVGEEPDAALAYVSKCYVLESFHGSGLSGALLEYALTDAARAWGTRRAVLGTNRGNKRAARFYRNHGFRKSGTRRFQVGDTLHHDFVFVRDLTTSTGE